MAVRRGSTRALRTASAGLEWGKTCPLMLFQQSAEFGVLRSEGSLCVVHTAMVILTMTPLQPPVRQAARAIEPWSQQAVGAAIAAAGADVLLRP
jgi:hypothetical protein